VAVSVEGGGAVVLVGSGGRYPVPGSVPPGRYEIEVTFTGQPAVNAGRITVREGSPAAVRCNERMGICSGR
jgi:hypothetical protein